MGQRGLAAAGPAGGRRWSSGTGTAMPARLPAPGVPDWWLLAAVGGLLAFGVVMVYSASFYWAMDRIRGDMAYYLRRELIFMGAGLACMVVAMFLPPRFWLRVTRPLLVVAFLLLLLVLLPVPGLSQTLGGASRWLGTGALTLQPSEVMKLALVLFVANLAHRKAGQERRPAGLVIPTLLVAGAASGLVLVQPHMSTALLLAGVAFCMLVAAEVPLVYLALLAAPVGPGIWYLAHSEDYRARRMLAFMNPFAYGDDEGWQITQGLYAMASGGATGVGLGQGTAKYLWIPEAHTEMIFAVVAEELGFAGALVLVGLFALFMYRGYLVALRAPDRFTRLTAFGLTTAITLQALLSLGVVTSSLPPTGVPLPLVAYGGSSLVMTLAGVGILLGISRYRSEDTAKGGA